ncbi:(2,3-dihydroxybenzoyl)adenylate synthase [Rhodococcus sp. NPDC058521]|uniref:(2,3-dihydroxybenzoyl)adenylate synthase n=1 Tax=Rhodococcus sp. NPDC058521 TaxID=3346536 RepID=UPI0036487B4F
MNNGTDFTPWPDELAQSYTEQGIWAGKTFGTVLHDVAASTPDAVAVIDAEQTWTFRELDSRVDALASGFHDRGIGTGDRVLLQLPNIAEFVEITFALFRSGAVPVFALPAHRSTELTAIAAASGAIAMIVTDQHLDLALETREVTDGLDAVILVGPSEKDTAKVNTLDAFRTPDGQLPDGPKASDVAFLQLSGGSTGIPKLIPRTHDDYLYSVVRSAEICELNSNSVYMATLPVAHNFPMSSPGILGAITVGGTVALAAAPSPDVAFPMIERAGVTITGLVPPLARLWTETRERGNAADLSSLKTLQVGGARCPDELAQRIDAAFDGALQQVFGMAEGLVCYTRLDDPREQVTTTQGRPMSPHDQIRLVDENDDDVPAGEAGALITQGPYTIRGYFRNEEANARSFTADGWYRTGDMARLDSAGNVIVTGRAADHVNRGGEKVSAEELEEHLLAHPQVRDAVVAAVPDKYLGQRTCAFVIAVNPDEPPKQGAVRKFVRERGLAEWKIPDLVRVIDSFPETGVGKTSRKDLRVALTAQGEGTN